jgi:putative glutamine amidotransferase
MPFIAVTQRVEVFRGPDGACERRDALDQAWPRFLARAGCLAMTLPNDPTTALRLFTRLPFDGLLLSGGNDLASLGGDAPERDRTELALLAEARRRQRPVIGVCRGMQIIQQAFGLALAPVAGHVADRLEIHRAGAPAIVNSSHAWGTCASSRELAVWARAGDGVVKAVRHVREPIVGVMWHPERTSPFEAHDLALFRYLFGGQQRLAG